MIVTLPDAARSRQATRSSRAISRGVSMSPSPGCGLRRLFPTVDDTVTAPSLTYPRQRPPRSSAGAAAPPPAAPRRLNQAPRPVPPAPVPSRSSISPLSTSTASPAPRGSARASRAAAQSAVPPAAPPLPGRPTIEIGWFVMLVPVWLGEADSTNTAGAHGAVP